MTEDVGIAAELEALATLTKLVAHAFAMVQSRSLAQRIVRDALLRHPRPRSSDERHLDKVLAEIGKVAGKVSPLHPEPARTRGAAAHAIAALAADERQALSLRRLFDFDDGRIASILGRDPCEVAAMVRIAENRIGTELVD